jgi:hypothetical protein
MLVILSVNVVLASCITKPYSTIVVNITCGGYDDTSSIQKVMNKVAATGGTVHIASGTCMINTIPGIRVWSYTTLIMDRGTILKAIPNDQDTYNILYVKNVKNVNVVGGTLQGDRYQHIAAIPHLGDWGMGINVEHSSNIFIENVISNDMWGDGFYQSGDIGQSVNIKFCGVVADNNRREGLSIENVDGMIVKDSVFKNTRGAWPQCGIDIEPYWWDQAVNNLQISNSKFINNDYGKCGIAIYNYIHRITNVNINGIIYTNPPNTEILDDDASR